MTKLLLASNATVGGARVVVACDGGGNTARGGVARSCGDGTLIGGQEPKNGDRDSLGE